MAKSNKVVSPLEISLLGMGFLIFLFLGVLVVIGNLVFEAKKQVLGIQSDKYEIGVYERKSDRNKVIEQLLERLPRP